MWLMDNLCERWRIKCVTDTRKYVSHVVGHLFRGLTGGQIFEIIIERGEVFVRIKLGGA